MLCYKEVFLFTVRGSVNCVGVVLKHALCSKQYCFLFLSSERQMLHLSTFFWPVC